MAPQTRSATKSSRTTRNSTYGRPPLVVSPVRLRKTTIKKPEYALAHDPQAEGDATPIVGDPAEKYRYPTSITLSGTGKGTHVGWRLVRNDNDDDAKVDEMDAEEVERIIEEDHDIMPITPPATAAGPCNGAAHSPLMFPETPMPLDAYEPGSVALTPVKRARPLQPSPLRIGDTRGIRCLFEQPDGVLRELNGGARVILRHAMGSSVNMSRDQLELAERGREQNIAQIQLEKLLVDSQRVREEEEIQCSDLEGDHDGSDSEMVVSLEDTRDYYESVRFRGPHGELLDQHGRPRFGPEGTLLVDPNNALPRGIMREDAFVTSRPRLGPCGTELID